MLSGGGSAIAEKPIDEEISLEDLVATYRALVLSGFRRVACRRCSRF